MTPIPLIEEGLKKNRKRILQDENQILLGLAKQLDWTERQVERWTQRSRRNKQNKHSSYFQLIKFIPYKAKFY